MSIDHSKIDNKNDQVIKDTTLYNFPQIFSSEQEKGFLVIISGPSGVGKGTVINKLIEENTDRLIRSVSVTTRQPRPGEEDGVDYFFSTGENFQKLIDNDQLLEYESIFNKQFYGTPRSFVVDNVEKGKDVILVIDVNGAMEVKKKYDDVVTIFLLPPDPQDLEKRLKDRNTEGEDAIKERLERSRKEINMIDKYDYIVVNDLVENAVLQIRAILVSEHLKTSRKLKERQIWLKG